MTDITAEDYRTAAKVDRHHGGQSTAQFYEDTAQTLAAADLITHLAKAVHETLSRGGWRGGRVPEHFEQIIAPAAAELDRIGRLVPVGGVALTAEQMEGVRTMMWSPGVTALEAFRRLRALFPEAEPTSSPVVPAPTETEWPTWEQVPEGVTVRAANRHNYTKRDGILCIGTSTLKSCLATSTQHLAPFVAAEEGDA